MENIAIIKYRMEHADESYSAAFELLQHQYYHGFTNRLYYSVFFAVKALLLVNNIFVTQHNEVRDHFFQVFITPGIFSIKFGELYKQLYELRLKADYEDLLELQENEVKPFLKPVYEFLDEVEIYINKNLCINNPIVPS